MKATKYIIGALAILLMAGSCKKNENTEATDFSASIEIDDSGKTELYDGTKVRWTQSDVIRVFGGTANDQKDYTLKSGFEHSQHGEFSCGSGGVKEGNNYWGFYPASLNPSRSGENISFTMPATQTAENGGFATNLNPMAARVTDGSTLLPFKNLFGLLKIELTTNTTITKVELIDEHNALSGTFTVDASTLNSTSGGFNNMTITKPDVSATNKTLTLNCSASSGAVLYFVIPPGALSQGFTVNFYRGTNGSSLVETKTISADPSLAMHSNQIKKMQVTANAQVAQVTNLVPQPNEQTWLVNYWTTNPDIIAEANTYDVNNRGTAIKFNTGTATGWVEAQVFPLGASGTVNLKNRHTYYLRWCTKCYDVSGGSTDDWRDSNHEVWFLGGSNNNINWIVSTAAGNRLDLHINKEMVNYSAKDKTLPTKTKNSWQINSAYNVFTGATGDYKLRIDINNREKKFGVNIACVMLVDLTADFAGTSIPTFQDCDNNVYFSGTHDRDTW